MKSRRIAILLIAGCVFSACAYIPPQEAIARRVSPDYTATGSNENARAYLYGNRTVLEFDGSPVFLSIKDETGAAVDYEKVGAYYRLPRRLDTFTVWANGSSVTFSAVATTRVFSAPTQSPAAIEAQRESPADAQLAELLKLSQKQIAEARRVLDATGKNPSATGAELFEVSQRLDEIETRLKTASTATLRVSFPTAGTVFKLGARQATILINAAKWAERIKVSGYTDSPIASPMDAKVALGRALAARNFLVKNGVSSDKITISSQPEGAFVAPNITKEGRALNRRVEIEVMNARIAALTTRTMKLATVKVDK